MLKSNSDSFLPISRRCLPMMTRKYIPSISILYRKNRMVTHHARNNFSLFDFCWFQITPKKDKFSSFLKLRPPNCLWYIFEKLPIFCVRYFHHHTGEILLDNGISIVTFPQLVQYGNSCTFFTNSSRKSHSCLLVVKDLKLCSFLYKMRLSLSQLQKTISFLVLLARLNEIMDVQVPVSCEVPHMI